MVDFAQSPRSTLGIEWELALVDKTNLDLVPRAGEVLNLVADAGLDSCIVGEMLTNTVEVVTGVHERVSDAVADLKDSVAQLREITNPLGLDLMSAGTHPFAHWREQQVTDKDRYAELINRTQWWGHHMLIYGVHTHVGVDKREYVLPIMNALMCYVPHLQAVSASSPFWEDTDTSYASNRAMLFQQLPTAGLPYPFTEWREYDKYVRDMLKTGVIDQINEIRWDIRPAPKWGTIEVRVCDGMPTIAEVAAVTAFVQCLVHHFCDRLDRGLSLPTMPQWFHVENKWRAARYGMDAIIIENELGRERLVKHVIADEVEFLTPIARELGCEDELLGMLEFARIGASYERQRAVYENTGDMFQVAKLLVDEFKSTRPSEVTPGTGAE